MHGRSPKGLWTIAIVQLSCRTRLVDKRSSGESDIVTFSLVCLMFPEVEEPDRHPYARLGRSLVNPDQQWVR